MSLPPPDLQSTKAELRRLLRRGRRRRSPAAVARDSDRICQRIRSLPEWRAARQVLLYHALPGEVDLGELQVAWEGTVPAYPVVVGPERPLEARLSGPSRRGAFGVLEPDATCPAIPLASIDLVVVPGLGFDRTGGRLGQGGGFYDRTLALTRALRVGVAFSGQLVDHVPVGRWDLSMDLIVTETEVLRPARSPPGR